MPETESITLQGDDKPIILSSRHSLPFDEVNPDELIAVFGLLVGQLEEHGEAHGIPLNWNTLAFGSLPSYPGAEHVAIYSASVKRLA